MKFVNMLAKFTNLLRSGMTDNTKLDPIIYLCDERENLLAENKLLKEEIAELRKLIPSEIDKLEDIKSYVREVNSRRRNSRPPI